MTGRVVLRKPHHMLNCVIEPLLLEAEKGELRRN